MQAAPSLPQVSQYTTLLEGESALYDRLSDSTAAGFPTDLHRLLAELPGRLRAKGYPANEERRFVIFSTAFDDLLERAFAEVEQPYHLFAYRHHIVDTDGVVHPGCFVHIPPGASRSNLLTPNTYKAVTTAIATRSSIKLCGQRVTQSPKVWSLPKITTWTTCPPRKSARCCP